MTVSGVKHLFWPIANSKTLEEYTLHLNQLYQVNKSAATYFSNINLSLLVTAYASGPNFDHKTSNVVESMNWVLKDE